MLSYAQCASCYKLFSNEQEKKKKHFCGLGRKKKQRNTRTTSPAKYKLLKPQGIPTNKLKIITLLPDEVEAIRLKNIDNLHQTEIAKKMSISQSTSARIIKEANKKIALALLNGYGVKLLAK